MPRQHPLPIEFARPFYVATCVLRGPYVRALRVVTRVLIRGAPKIYIPVTFSIALAANISRMPPISQEPLTINDLKGPQPGQRILCFQGPIVLGTLFQFQSAIRAKDARALILDFTSVPYIDSAGVGALVGAYVTHNKDGRSLALVGVSARIHAALEVTHVDQFFRFFDTVAEAEQGA